MIFTRRFGALRALPTDFASTIVKDAAAQPTQTELHDSALLQTEETTHNGHREHAA